MEQVSGLYNPGFVGSQFHWWLGQVCDSSTWRDNQSDTSYDNPEDVPGWGYRYKVRIMGLHDPGEAEIESDQLPWCQSCTPCGVVVKVDHFKLPESRRECLSLVSF